MAKRLNKRRLGKCYELAGSAFMDNEYTPIENAVPGSVRLVHGTIQGAGFTPNPHAWLRYEIALGDMGNGDAHTHIDYGTVTMVWEPVGDQHLPWGYFEHAYNAIEYHAYTYDEFRDKIVGPGVKNAHWGPWDGDYHRVEYVQVGKRKMLKKVVSTEVTA